MQRSSYATAPAALRGLLEAVSVGGILTSDTNLGPGDGKNEVGPGR